jgi:hypothetical protein
MFKSNSLRGNKDFLNLSMSDSTFIKLPEKETVSLNAIKYHPFNFFLLIICAAKQSNVPFIICEASFCF